MMTTERQKRLGELAWRQKARRARKRIIDCLAGVLDLDDGFFLDQSESRDFGRRFWARVEGVPERVVRDFEECLPLLALEHWPDSEVVYLHNAVEEAGAISIGSHELLENIREVTELLGPDVLFAGSDMTFGFCYEQSEYEGVVRLWGVFV